MVGSPGCCDQPDAAKPIARSYLSLPLKPIPITNSLLQITHYQFPVSHSPL
ncbi:hypothetical protein QUA83_04810 [Microcoleus sp. K1-B1]|uniref:hypothetical protein n=1 Tax=Microcoleus sp. K1-B6 TaxID=2818787 RepID=UPI002FD80B81